LKGHVAQLWRIQSAIEVLRDPYNIATHFIDRRVVGKIGVSRVLNSFVQALDLIDEIDSAHVHSLAKWARGGAVGSPTTLTNQCTPRFETPWFLMLSRKRILLGAELLLSLDVSTN
jgi:hypothetical protein